MRNCLLILSALAFLAPGQELIRNGDFETGFEFWLEEVNNDQGSYEISRCTTYRQEPGYSARIHKYMRYYARLSQAVAIPGTNLRFSAAARLLASKGSTSGYYACAALILEYLDSGDSVLGRTIILRKVGDYDPQNTPTQHVILATGENWQDHELLLAEELAGLTGIDPADVAGVKVILESYGTGSSG